MKVENGSLVVNDGQVIVLPEIQSDATVRVWEVPADYRDNGLFVAVILPGQPAEIPACSPADAQYLGEVAYLAPDANKLAAAKVAKLVQLNEGCDLALAALTSTYPPGELQSWPQQVQEAAALLLDPPGATPLLSTIAEVRGVPLALLAERVQEKAVAYGTASGEIIGKRQRLEDLLGKAADMAEVEVITW